MRFNLRTARHSKYMTYFTNSNNRYFIKQKIVTSHKKSKKLIGKRGETNLKIRVRNSLKHTEERNNVLGKYNLISYSNANYTIIIEVSRLKM